MIISARTAKFLVWLQVKFANRSAQSDRADVDLLTELEAAARLARHDYETMGECKEDAMKRLCEASRMLQEAYESE